MLGDNEKHRKEFTMNKIKKVIHKIKNYFFKKQTDLICKQGKYQSKITSLCDEVNNTRFTKKLPKLIATTGATMLATMSTSMTVFATGADTSSIDKFVDFACEWLKKIGAVVMLVGGVMFALGWQREDAEGKTRGLQTLMAGGMIVALGASKNIFGL